MSIPTLPDEVREQLRHRCQTDTYFLAKAVLGFPDLTLDCHLPMCQFMEGPAKRKLALVPRGHLKTHCWTLADTVRRIVANPNIRILIANETFPNASHFIQRLQAIWMRNRLFQTLFPELIWPNFNTAARWNQAEMLVPRTNDYPEATVEAMGVGAAVVSRHYNLIKLDDLVGKEASESPTVMRKTIDWYQYCESLLEAPERDEMQTYGTPWGFADLYSWIPDNEPDVSILFRSCYRDAAQTTPLWPERFSLEGLERLRRKMGSFKFSCQYLCKPFDPEATNLKEEWLRYYRFDGDYVKGEGRPKVAIDTLQRTMRVDPALSEEDDAARSAIVIDGVAPDNSKYLLDVWVRRCQPLDMIDAIFALQAQWDCESIGIEAVAYQKALKPFVEQEADRRGVWLNVIDLKPGNRIRKAQRIRGLQPYFERGEYFVRRDQGEFLREYREFPIGKTVDILDALSYGPDVWRAPDDEAILIEEQRDYWTSQEGRSELTGY